MTRLNALLKTLEEGSCVDRLNNRPNPSRAEVITETQARYDHLAGVPKQCTTSTPITG